MKTSPIIQPSELLQLQLQEFVLIDASAGAKARYDEAHLLGALYIDLNTDLANIENFAIGGRHPLPSLTHFAQVLQKFGIDKNSHVVVYDDKNGSNAAARFWWMLKAVGHQKVQVLNGGYEAAVKAGFPKTKNTSTAKAANLYKINGWGLPLANINEVEMASKTHNQTIVDVRDAHRFAGLTEPIDLIAGHIPNAINIPFTQNLDENGFFLAPNVLKQQYEVALPNGNADGVIVHCGSGVTACHMLLAMAYAGLAMPKLYIGSWSEWSRNQKEMILAKPL